MFLSVVHIYPQSLWWRNMGPMNYRVTVAAILASTTYWTGSTEFDKAAVFQYCVEKTVKLQYFTTWNFKLKLAVTRKLGENCLLMTNFVINLLQTLIRKRNVPGSESCDLVSFAQTCAWALSVAPPSSGRGRRRSVCHSSPSHSSHPPPVANEKTQVNFAARNGGHFQVARKLQLHLLLSGRLRASQSWRNRSLETFRYHLS